MLRAYAANFHKSVPAELFPHKFNTFSSHYTIDCAVSPYLPAEEYCRLFEFLNDTLVHMQPEVLNIGTFKMFKTFETRSLKLVFCWYSDLISHTHVHKDTQHNQGPID